MKNKREKHTVIPMLYQIIAGAMLAVLTLFACVEDNGVVPQPDPLDPFPTELLVDSVQHFNQMISAYTEEWERLGLSFYHSDFEPTGVYLEPYAKLKVKVTLDEGNDYPELLIGTYSRGEDWNTKPENHELKEGINTINAGNIGGLVYIRFTSDEKKPQGKVTIEFQEGWTHSPVYHYKKTTNANWKKMLSGMSGVRSVTLIGEKTFLVVSLENALKYQSKNQDELLETIDAIMKVQNDLSGLDGSSELHQPIAHKLLMAEYTGQEYYMFAYDYRMAFRELDAVKYILDPALMKSDGWGPWHEIGHMHQMYAWTWDEVTEVTVNLFSLVTEKYFGIKESRLKRDGHWEEIKKYLDKPENTKSFNSDATSVWVRLGMFYQLHLAFGDMFYPDLHKYFREEKPETNNDQDMMRNFMIAACKVSGKDLTSFFKKWALKFSNSDQVYTEIEQLGLPVPDTDLCQITE